MKRDCYEVKVFHDAGDVLCNERIYCNDPSALTSFVELNPNVGYYVQVIVSKDARGRWPADRVYIGLFVDDTELGYWKTLDLTREGTSQVTTTFWGTCMSTNEIEKLLAQSTHLDWLPDRYRSDRFRACMSDQSSWKSESILNDNWSDDCFETKGFIVDGQQSRGKIRVRILNHGGIQKMGELHGLNVTCGKIDSHFGYLRNWGDVGMRELCAMNIECRSKWVLRLLDEVRKEVLSDFSRLDVEFFSSDKIFPPSKSAKTRTTSTGIVRYIKHGFPLAAPQAASSSSSRTRTASQVTSSSSSSSADDGEVVQIAAPPKIVPILDLSDESRSNPTWKTTAIPR